MHLVRNKSDLFKQTMFLFGHCGSFKNLLKTVNIDFSVGTEI